MPPALDLEEAATLELFGALLDRRSCEAIIGYQGVPGRPREQLPPGLVVMPDVEVQRNYRAERLAGIGERWLRKCCLQPVPSGLCEPGGLAGSWEWNDFGA